MPKYKGVIKRRNKWFYYIYHHGKQIWSKGFDMAEEAVKARAKALNEIHNQDAIKPNNIKVKDFIIQYLEVYAKPNLRTSTVVQITSLLRLYIIPEIGSMRLQDLKPLNLMQLQNKLLRNKTPTVAYNTMRTVRKILNKAFQWDFIQYNPVSKIQLPRVPRKEHPILTPEQLFYLVDNLQGRDKYIVALAAFAGLRRSEIFGLMWKDFDFKNNRIDLQRQFINGELTPLKTESSRVVISIWKKLTKMMMEWKLQSGSPVWVFKGRGYKPFAPESWCSDEWIQIRKKFSLPEGLRFHDLRHTFASIMLAKGTSVADVQKLLRHASYQTTIDIYRHLLPNQLENALESLDHLYIEQTIEQKRPNFLFGKELGLENSGPSRT